jgi:hypothetical protein
MNTVLKSIIVLAIAAMVGIGVGFLGYRSEEFQPPLPLSKATQTAATDLTASTPVAAQDANKTDQVANILAADGDSNRKAQQLLSIAFHLLASEQTEAVQHACNLADDGHYDIVAKCLENPDTPPSIRETLMADLLNRPDEIKEKTLHAIAQTIGHPQASEAKELLTLLGTDTQAPTHL